MGDDMAVDVAPAVTATKMLKRVRFVEEIHYIPPAEYESDDDDDDAMDSNDAFASLASYKFDSSGPSSMLSMMAASMPPASSKKPTTTMDLLDAFLSTRASGDDEDESSEDDDEADEDAASSTAQVAHQLGVDAAVAPFQLRSGDADFDRRADAAFAESASASANDKQDGDAADAHQDDAMAVDGDRILFRPKKTASASTSSAASELNNADMEKFKQAIGLSGDYVDDPDAIDDEDDMTDDKLQQRARDSVSLRKLKSMAAQYYRKKETTSDTN